ncbi:hypothetical protein [Magnetospirillum molischianum]|uniref:Uncharacterized protein n=1 Tax=Magnetospirillum molischianum DSM 120 TaxID=1150626 RepID=H8FQU6_MAGML|nr:hypothetical protein [Magnetospirillum molischianum]CCG40734.1 hypothetical protein PHAMO_210245 [Magnetospirillum molischianum DSM 120]
MTDYKAQVRDDYEAVNGTVDRLYADIFHIKTADGRSVSYRASKNIDRLRLGQSVCVISHKGAENAALILNRTTRKTLRIECSMTGTAMSKYVAGLILYALGAVAFFSGLLDPDLATKLGLGLFAIGLGVIVFTPIRDDNAYADAFNAFVDEQWKSAPTGAGAGFLTGSAFR